MPVGIVNQGWWLTCGWLKRGVRASRIKGKIVREREKERERERERTSKDKKKRKEINGISV